MLYLEIETDTFVAWDGKTRIGDILYPTNIEQLWSPEDLAAIGLYSPAPADDVPTDKIVVSTSVQRVNGQVKFVNTLDDRPLEEITPEMVNEERNRRIATGVTFNGKTFDFDTDSKSRVIGVATLAGFAIGAGAQPGDYYWHGGEQPFSWIVNDNTVMQLDAQMTFQLGQTAATWETVHIFAARALKEMNPIPQDYKDDIYWP